MAATDGIITAQHYEHPLAHPEVLRLAEIFALCGGWWFVQTEDTCVLLDFRWEVAA